MFLAGLMPEYRGLGLDALLYTQPFDSAQKLKLTEGELSWELEDNFAIIKPIEKLGGRIYKRMRIWDKEI
jgi:hypothetical protein